MRCSGAFVYSCYGARGGRGEGLKGLLKFDVLIVTGSTVTPTGTEEARLLPSVLICFCSPFQVLVDKCFIKKSQFLDSLFFLVCELSLWGLRYLFVTVS